MTFQRGVQIGLLFVLSNGITYFYSAFRLIDKVEVALSQCQSKTEEVHGLLLERNRLRHNTHSWDPKLL